MRSRTASSPTGKSVLERAKHIHSFQSKRKKPLTEAGKHRKALDRYWNNEATLQRRYRPK